MLNLTNQEFGSLVVKKEVDRIKYGKKWYRNWLCLCDPKLGGCGREVIVRQDNLRSGNTSSCGCYEFAPRYKHGMRWHPLYFLWKDIKARCYNDNEKAYKYYGKRGIGLAKIWYDNPKLFIEYIEKELGPKPSEYHTLDRIDNNGHYVTGNLKWSTDKEQANNRRRRIKKE